jgi:transcriptional regulator with XRE-family HTH domain
MPPDPALGVAVRQLREARGLSQEALAYRAGTTYGTINRLELAQSAPAWGTVRAIADALDITLTELAAAIEAQGQTRELDDQAQKSRKR